MTYPTAQNKAMLLKTQYLACTSTRYRRKYFNIPKNDKASILPFSAAFATGFRLQNCLCKTLPGMKESLRMK